MKGHGLAIGLEEQGVGCCSRCSFAAIPGLQLPAIVIQEKGSAADTAGLRLDQAQYQLDGDGGIQGATTGLQDLEAGTGGDRRWKPARR